MCLVEEWASSPFSKFDMYVLRFTQNDRGVTSYQYRCFLSADWLFKIGFVLFCKAGLAGHQLTWGRPYFCNGKISKWRPEFLDLSA